MILTVGRKTALSVFVRKVAVETYSCDGIGSIPQISLSVLCYVFQSSAFAGGKICFILICRI